MLSFESYPNMIYNCFEGEKWSFDQTFVYVGSVATTIGFGNVTPKTQRGKILTMCVAGISIPLFGILCSKINKQGNLKAFSTCKSFIMNGISGEGNNQAAAMDKKEELKLCQKGLHRARIWQTNNYAYIFHKRHMRVRRASIVYFPIYGGLDLSR